MENSIANETALRTKLKCSKYVFVQSVVTLIIFAVDLLNTPLFFLLLFRTNAPTGTNCTSNVIHNINECFLFSKVDALTLNKMAERSPSCYSRTTECPSQNTWTMSCKSRKELLSYTVFTLAKNRSVASGREHGLFVFANSNAKIRR